MVISETEVYKAMEEWALWKRGESSDAYGGGTVLGKVLDGMPSTRCTSCQGGGRVKAIDYKRTNHFTVCPLCKGRGKVKPVSTANKINPAFIHSTATGYGSENPKSEFIDFLVSPFSKQFSVLPFAQRQVIVVEFREELCGTQKQKASRIRLPAKRQQRKDGISTRYYRLLLRTALAYVEAKLIDRKWLSAAQLNKKLVK